MHIILFHLHKVEKQGNKFYSWGMHNIMVNLISKINYQKVRIVYL